MSFFGKSSTNRKIVLDTEATDFESPEMIARMNRIENNYVRLDEILTELETRFELDQRLAVDSGDRPQVEDGLPKKPR